MNEVESLHFEILEFRNFGIDECEKCGNEFFQHNQMNRVLYR